MHMQLTNTLENDTIFALLLEFGSLINLSKKHMQCSVLLVLFGILKTFTQILNLLPLRKNLCVA